MNINRGGQVLPIWLYSRRTFAPPCAETITRVGSATYGLVVTHVSGDAYTTRAVLATVWRFHFGYGPGDGISAGFGDAGIRGRYLDLPGGRTIAIGWKPR